MAHIKDQSRRQAATNIFGHWQRKSFKLLIKEDGTMIVSWEDKTNVFVTQFARNSTIDP